MNNFTLKVLYLSKKKKKKKLKRFSPASDIISVPWLVNPSQAWSTGKGEKNAPLWFQSKEEKNLMHTPQTFYLFIYVFFLKDFSHHNTLYW